MKSVLLGGLKTWLVNDGGKPLSAPGGRAKFYTAGTSTPETVYSDIDLTEGTAFGPEVHTDKLGYLPAIWLKTDRLYKVVVEQRIGRDPETWEVLWEVDNVGYIDPHEAENSGESPITVNSVADLKGVDYDAHGYVLVLGYFSPGDWGEPSMFWWDPECRKAPEDGAYVLPNDMQSTSPGRWRQVFSGSVLDVRKFGALPDQYENSDVQGKVVNAVSYAQDNSTRTRPLVVGFVAPGRYDFVGDFDFSIYTFTNVDDQSLHRVKWLINHGVVLNNSGVVASTFKLEKDTLCLSRETLVTGDVTLVVEGGGSIKVDPAWWGDKECEVTGCYVECGSVTTNRKRFIDCRINSNRLLDGYVVLNNCGFSQSWFVDGFNFGNVSLINAKYDVHDCYTANDYIRIKNSQYDSNYGDLAENTISNVQLRLNAVLENAYFENVTIQDNAELHNVSGSVDIRQTTSAQNWIDCWITLTSDATVNSLELRRGSISGGKLTVNSAFTAIDVDILSQVVLEGATPDVRRCRIGAKITQKDNAGSIAGVFESCSFSAAHELDPVTADTVVSVFWRNNHATVNPITVVDRSKLKAGESSHNYVYEQNTGMFLPLETEYTEKFSSSDIALLPWDESGTGYGKITLVSGNQLIPASGTGFFRYIIGVNIDLDSHSLSLFNITGKCKVRYDGDVVINGFTSDWSGTPLIPYSTSVPIRKEYSSVEVSSVDVENVNGFWKAWMIEGTNENMVSAIVTINAKRI